MGISSLSPEGDSFHVGVFHSSLVWCHYTVTCVHGEEQVVCFTKGPAQCEDPLAFPRPLTPGPSASCRPPPSYFATVDPIPQVDSLCLLG